MSNRARIAAPAAAVTLALTALAVASGAGGDLDPGFGNGGKVVSGRDQPAGAQALAIQRDGKILVTAAAGGAPAIARFRRDGSVDESFGDLGRVPTVGFGLALQRDGKIVAGGSANGDFALARHRPDGSLDPSFGDGGRVATDLGGFELLAAVLVRGDGTVVAVGTSFTGIVPRVAVAQYRPDGRLDPAFGEGGRLVTLAAAAQAAALARDGRLVVLGARLSAEGLFEELVLARITARGAFDTSFSGDGIATARPEVRGGPAPAAVAVQADGKVVVAGLGVEGNAFGALRFRANGTRDATFGSTAARGQPYPVYGLRAVAVDARGRVVVAGSGPDLFVDLFLARLTPAGRLDPRFGGDGVVTTDLGGREDATALALQPDGKVVAAGWTGASISPAQRRLALVRYRASTCRVPRVTGNTLRAATRALQRRGCLAGAVTRAKSSAARAGRVLRQRPAAGTVVPDVRPVTLVVGRGR